MAEVVGNTGDTIVLPSGYEYDFISTVFDEYYCLICHLPLREPVLTRCGHRYCKKCLDKAIRRLPFPQCPTDRETLDPEKDIFPDKATERYILSCHVKCPSEGCEWTGETRYVETHLQNCDCKLIPCPNSKCHMTMERRVVKDHVANLCQWRMVPCEYCDEKHAKCDEKKHTSECQKLPTDCSNGCGEVIAREENSVAKYLEKKGESLEKLNCNLVSETARTTVRNQISNHIENDCPLTLVSCPYVKMGCETKAQREKLNCHLQSATGHHLDLACVKLHDTQVQLNNTQDQLHNTQETTKELAKKVDALQKELKEKLDEKQVMQINKGKSFMWKIDEFSEFLWQAKTGQSKKIESVPFYTESCGYKLKIVFYPNGNGDGNNTHLSVFNSAVKGEYDAILQWPLQRAVRFTLIDQQCDALHRENVQLCFTQTINRPNEDSNDDNPRGFPKFISHEKLKTRRYLVDDTLFLQIEIGPTVNELKSWSTSSLYTCELATQLAATTATSGSHNWQPQLAARRSRTRRVERDESPLLRTRAEWKSFGRYQ